MQKTILRKTFSVLLALTLMLHFLKEESHE